MNHKSNMNAGEESDDRVVPAKCPNKDGSLTLAEGAEGRRSTKENSGQTTASQTQSWGNALSGLHRVREAAKKDKRLQFTALLHHVSVPLLLDSFYALKREAAPGVDGLTWQEYETDLDKRLEDLHSRVHGGTYRALPSKRAYILKQDGRQRPLGIAALEDKIVQHAVGTVLNQIYEEDFLGFSYGFRPRRGTHDALDALWVGIMRKKVNWVLDADIRDCFGSFSHGWMVKFLQHRIGDSPLLCNVYLHYVFEPPGRRPWLGASASAAPKDRKRNVGRRCKAAAKSPSLAKSPFLSPTIPHPRVRRPSAISESGGGSVDPRFDAGGTSPSIRAKKTQSSHEYRHPAPNSLSSS